MGIARLPQRMMVFIRRQVRRERSHPRDPFDNSTVWTVTQDETLACCDTLPDELSNARLPGCVERATNCLKYD
jgi:hypothetical protein